MTRWRRATLVAAGGALGGALRWALTGLTPALAGDLWLTAVLLLAVNVSGSLLAGFTRGLCAADERRRGAASPEVERIEAFLVTGFCGGFTSYSAFVAFSLDGAGLGTALSAAIAAATVLLCPLAAFAGMHVGGGYPAPSAPEPQDSPR